MKDQLIIIGAGGHGCVVADIATRMRTWRRIAFLDDYKVQTQSHIEIIGSTKKANEFSEVADFFVALGDNKIRQEKLEWLANKRMTIARLVHPDSVIGSDVEIGAGTVVMAGVVINCGTKVGKGCILNTCSSLDHNNIIEDYVHISPGARTAGYVNIGYRSWLCIGSIVSNNVSICSDCIIGAGSVVLKDIHLKGTYIGLPARRLDR